MADFQNQRIRGLCSLAGRDCPDTDIRDSGSGEVKPADDVAGAWVNLDHLSTLSGFTPRAAIP